MLPPSATSRRVVSQGTARVFLGDRGSARGSRQVLLSIAVSFAQTKLSGRTTRRAESSSEPDQRPWRAANSSKPELAAGRSQDRETLHAPGVPARCGADLPCAKGNGAR